MKINIGCGLHPLPQWINVDKQRAEGVDRIVDLERAKLPFDDNSASQIRASHVLEHIQNILPLMQELYRIAVPSAVMLIHVPYGNNPDAWEDPTHVRAFYEGSFGYFSQPYYWRANYGYTGDWQPTVIYFTVVTRQYAHPWQSPVCVDEMTAVLQAMKPARPPLRELQTKPQTLIGDTRLSDLSPEKVFNWLSPVSEKSP